MEKFSSFMKMAPEPRINARTVLWYLVFVGFAVNYMIRINMNITIVTMVKQAGGKRVSQHFPPDSSIQGLNSTVVLATQQQPKMYACYVERNESHYKLDDLSQGSSYSASLQNQPRLLSPEIVLLKALKVKILSYISNLSEF